MIMILLRISHIVTHRLMPLFALVLSLGACSTSSDKPPNSYDWTETPDYYQMRQKIGWDENFFSICQKDRPLKAMTGAMNDKQWEKAADQGLNWLNRCPIDMRAHYYTGIALSELGREQEAKDHFRWTKGLMDSLVASGDGKTPETAYVTISVAEEYDVIYFFGLKLKSQSLVSSSVMCDLLTVENDKGEEISIYFNPAAHFARLYKMIK